jgi:O-antigen biosynthesis protein WbqP
MPEDVKAKFDGEYAQNITFKMDMKIILRTFLYLTKKPPTY